MSPEYITHHKLYLAGAMMLLAALVFAGAVFYLVSAYRAPAADGSRAPALLPGQKNPADDLPRASAEVSAVSGSVAAVAQNSLTVAPERGGAPVTILTDSKTEIYKTGAQKEQSAYDKELQIFKEKLEYANDITTVYFAPDPYEHVPLALADLKAGEKVIVTPAGKNARGELVALRVYVFSSAR